MTNYGSILNPKRTSQTERAKEDQVKNNAGGYVFDTGDMMHLDRFLILGAEGPTYYASQRDLVESAATSIISLIRKGERVVDRTKEISLAGRAARNDPALFVLALASKYGNLSVRQDAHDAVPVVARTFDHLALLSEMRKSLGLGEGRGWRRAVANWYVQKESRELAYQVAKYPSRRGWTHKDMLLVSHPKTFDPTFNAIAQYALGKADYRELDHLPMQIYHREEAMHPSTPKGRVIQLIRQGNLTHEMIPNRLKSDADVWEALLERMPIWATIRNLGKMTKVGTLGTLKSANNVVVERLLNENILSRSRIHPLTLLQALYTYKSGKGMIGSLEWTPVQPIVDALEKAFFMAFDSVEPTGKRILMALDVSGSMGAPLIKPKNNIRAGASSITVREAASCLALALAKTEKNYHITGFSHEMIDLGITANTSLSSAVSMTSGLRFGATDCALPMLYALGENAVTRGSSYYRRHSNVTTSNNILEVDAFVVITDNETWHGGVHPYQALNLYREKTGIDAKLVVWAMTSTGFTIADPSDPGMLDVVGYDSAALRVIADFIRD